MDAGQDETVGPDRSSPVLRKTRIRYRETEEREGIAGNAIRALLATGEFIALLDHDDICPVLCGTWHRPFAEQGAVLCIRMK